ncbi:MAG: class A beta-lactamase-related serine hydrolase [Gammaproteobacteria bacterium]|nr:class A beta-lactamase-related serine hydrolase [Gammaproteobacteria bacterium]MBT8094406.1 class A beta-lactamase-related serine hydrolase [Gammaproteobacteria bacterium]MBT8104745.1 class A beta-lactamase-related serine hydrolase [Gammaproteobacteria bacterium]NNK24759.1 hypothetical protein [Woeseiaceae bacterium]NNL64286.1 hypothetical protein [Woeseiaceae bacterium]
MLLVATGLIVFIGLAHSYLGERYILVRLFRRPLPKLFGSDEFTKKTLRFAWHITTIAWIGFAAILWQVDEGHVSRANLLGVIGVVFGISALVALLASRGRHLSWLVFGAISVICFTTDGVARDVIDAETASIAGAVARLESEAVGDVEYSVWLGQPDGHTWYEHNADDVRPAASAIKTAILVEFLSTQLDSLDEPFDALEAIVDNPASPAIRHFDADQEAYVQNELRDLTARQLAQAMVHTEHTYSNAAYNAAANVIIEYLGGPEALSERLQRRFPDAAGLQVARYMLADRQQNPDNLLTARSLATILRYLAQDGPTDELRTAARAILLYETDANRGDHYYKGGSLRSDPQVRIESGWWDHRGAAVVYAVIATRPSPAKSDEDYDNLRSDLSELSRIVQYAGKRIRDAQAVD